MTVHPCTTLGRHLYGPHGRARALKWAGSLGGAMPFLDSAASVAFWQVDDRLVLDCEDGRLQVAEPGDWLVYEDSRFVVRDPVEIAELYQATSYVGSPV